MSVKAQKPGEPRFNDRVLLSGVKCITCGTEIPRFTRFNDCREEDVPGEKYLGYQICRFYINCTNCSTEIVIKENPQFSDLVVEAGATRVVDMTPVVEIPFLKESWEKHKNRAYKRPAVVYKDDDEDDDRLDREEMRLIEVLLPEPSKLEPAV